MAATDAVKLPIISACMLRGMFADAAGKQRNTFSSFRMMHILRFKAHVCVQAVRWSLLSTH